MDYLSCCLLLLVVSGAGRVLAEQRLSCPGTAVGSASHTGSTGSRWEVIMNVTGERSGAAGQETAGEAVPEFYVALEFTGDGRCCRPGLPFAPLTEAVVRVTATGTALATISAPRPYGTLTGVTAAADNRTFALAAQKLARLPLATPPAARFFLLCVDPASRAPAGRARLEPLAIPEQPPGRMVSGLAVSPRCQQARGHRRPVFGSHRPARVHPGHRGRAGVGRTRGRSRLRPGRRARLPVVGRGRPYPGADQLRAPSPDRGVRLLDTAAPGSSLLASSRLILPTPAGPENSSGNYWRQVLISAGGQVIIAVIQVEAHHASGRMPGVTQKLVTFSANTGTLLRELNHLPVHGGYEHVPWASPSGQLLIVTGTQPGPTIGSFNLGHSAGTLSQGRFTPIPWSTRTFAAAW